MAGKILLCYDNALIIILFLLNTLVIILSVHYEYSLDIKKNPVTVVRNQNQG